MPVDEDMYRPGCRTPKPPVRGWVPQRAPKKAEEHVACFVRERRCTFESKFVAPTQPSPPPELSPRLLHGSDIPSAPEMEVKGNETVPAADDVNPTTTVIPAVLHGGNKLNRYDYSKWKTTQVSRREDHVPGFSSLSPKENPGLDSRLFELATSQHPALRNTPSEPHKNHARLDETLATLYDREVNRVRRTGLGQKPQMVLQSLAVKTFDLPPSDAHVQLTKDIERDEYLVKLKHHREAILREQAIIKSRRAQMRRKQEERHAALVETGLMFEQPFAVNQAKERIAQEWIQQMESKAKADGFQLGPTAKQRQKRVAKSAAEGLTARIIEQLQSSNPEAFGQTARQREFLNELEFLESAMQMSQAAWKLCSEGTVQPLRHVLPKRPPLIPIIDPESKRIVASRRRTVPSKPARCTLSCELGSENDVDEVRRLTDSDDNFSVC